MLQVRHHDFRDRLPDVDPNDVVQQTQESRSRGSVFDEGPGRNETVTKKSNGRSLSLPARLSKGAVLMTLGHGDWANRPD